jgi:hypothetical protein
MLVTRRHFVLAVVIAIVFSTISQSVVVYGQGLTQIFGRKPVSSVRGNKADISPGTMPASNFIWIASPVGICTADPCVAGSGFFETGYYHREGWTTVRQYAASQNNGGSGYVFWTSAYDINQWASYNFKDLYSNSAGRWEAWLNSDVPYYRYGLNFTSGAALACGGEANNANVTVDVRCNNNQYKVGTGSWTSWMFTYQSPQFTPGGYCVRSTGADDFRAHGPGVQSCP